MFSKQVEKTAAVLSFFDQQKGSVMSNKNLTEQPILLTKRKIYFPGYTFSKYVFSLHRGSQISFSF